MAGEAAFLQILHRTSLLMMMMFFAEAKMCPNDRQHCFSVQAVWTEVCLSAQFSLDYADSFALSKNEEDNS